MPRVLCAGLATLDAIASQFARAGGGTAALSCRALDGRSAIPTLDEVERTLS